VEATCAQYQCRFKRTGQFWSPAGDEALLCLDTFWRNERWPLLFRAHPPRQPVQKLKCAVRCGGHLARISHAAAGLRPLYDGPLGGVAGSSQTRPASGHVRFLPALQPGRGSERAVRRLRQPGLGPDAEQEEGVGHGVVGPGAAGAVLEVCADVDGLAVETLPGKQGLGLFQA